MSNNYQICEYYIEGMCFYMNHKYAIFEKCQFEKFKDNKIKYMKECKQREMINNLEKLVENK